jgi:hypothetical protein
MRQDEGAHDEALPLIRHRKGYAEEVYATFLGGHLPATFSYSPIPDDHGGLGGILCPVTEETNVLLASAIWRCSGGRRREDY